jgi:hypothetical protein
LRISARSILISFAALALASCAEVVESQFAELAHQPLATEPYVRKIDPWPAAGHNGLQITTDHYTIRTTLDDPLMQHLLVRVVEAAYVRNTVLAPLPPARALECYVFAGREQWESYTRAQGGSNAPIYLQIASGGFCHDGIFAGYDIGHRQTLSVIAHETWHQVSWFSFKNRLPSWLEEGMATQNEAIIWIAGHPTFDPDENSSRIVSLRQADRNNKLWKLSDLLATHAGRVIKMPQPNIDAYYAQLWSFTLFLCQSPTYAPRLANLLADARDGKLTAALAGTSVTQREIDNFTEHWNTVAGPLYLRKYVSNDLDALEREYLDWMRRYIGNH